MPLISAATIHTCFITLANMNIVVTYPAATTQKDMLRSILNARKSRKISYGGEAIWSLELEAALLEGNPLCFGLAQYQPRACRETLMLGRFPGRNQFLSQYIMKQTGQRRTNKQIGSRLQQLREYCQDQELWDLLFPAPKSATDDHRSSLPPTPFEALVPDRSNLVIFIDILPPGIPELSIEVPLQPWSEGAYVIHVSSYPRQLAYIDPSVTFLSRSPIVAQSQFTIWTEDNVQTETAAVTFLDEAHLPDSACFIHSAVLVPAHWKTIVESRGLSIRDLHITFFHIHTLADPTRYTIFHQVIKADDSVVVFSATYCFRYATGFRSTVISAVDGALRKVDLVSPLGF
ncbi:hypothetical protein C8R44DRAFT_740690 [Mycena epipterygia]|nr:hypothetical protein C8R44DRAFT_740690 [Mycena epipterygia]